MTGRCEEHKVLSARRTGTGGGDGVITATGTAPQIGLVPKFDGTAAGTFVILGGTGAYAGASGSGTFTSRRRPGKGRLQPRIMPTSL
ncbi:MAG: hypothetical protein M3326_16660 [Actinomycetota bacterium]|nr:hypothetical protein [Actinomycetota bacterium]